MGTHAQEAIVSCRLGYEVQQQATIVLNVAASTVGQTVLEETWQVDRDDVGVEELDTDGSTRLHRLVVGPGPLSVRYEARVGLPPALRTTDPGPPPRAPRVFAPTAVSSFVSGKTQCS